MKTPLLVTVALAASLCAAPALVGEPAAVAAPALGYGVTWTVDTASASVSAYAAGAKGAASPVATISGASTGLSAPTAVQVSSTGTIYVANSGNSSITSYAPGADGDIAPTATIEGAATGLDAPSSLTLADGDLWTTDPATNVVEAFTAGSSGNELPDMSIAGSRTKLNHPVAVAVDTSANEFGGEGGLAGVYVVNRPTSGAASVTGYLSGRYGDRAPVVSFTGSVGHPMTTPSAVLSVGLGAIWVADQGDNTLSEFFYFPGIPLNGPLATLKGSKTGLDLPTSVSVNALDDLVVGNAGSHTLTVYAPDAHGNVAPLHSVSGVGGDTGSPADAAVYGTAPGRPTAVTAALHRSTSTTGSSARVTWKPPAVTGGGVIGYEVDVEGEAALGNGELDGSGSSLGNVTVGTVDVTTRSTSITVRHLALGATYTVFVTAVNAFGGSAPVRSARLPLVIPPSAPQDVRLTTAGRAVGVTWKAPKHDGGDAVTRYRVEYATCAPGSKGCATHSRTVAGALHGVTLGGLRKGTTYYVRVAARTKAGLGASSAVVKGTTRG